MIHQPMGGFQGRRPISPFTPRKSCRCAKLNEIMALHTGQPVDRIERIPIATISFLQQKRQNTG